VQALHGADFILEEGEIHALLGENGAGKSTLMGIAFGLIRPDAGQVLVRGTPQQIRGPLDARHLGIGPREIAGGAVEIARIQRGARADQRRQSG
jgi:simple sugar transport system ATP-binding protein